MSDRIDLVALRRPIAVVFPDGAEHAVAPFRLDGVRLLRQWYETPDDVELLLALVRLAVPDATDADLNTLSIDQDIPRILAAASGKIALMEAALKNVPSGADEVQPASPSPLSSPTTLISTS